MAERGLLQRFDQAGPLTWLLAAGAGWALLLWFGALLGMGGQVSQAQASAQAQLPQPGKATPDRIGPLAQYADAASRPLFTEDRRPRSFLATAGEGDGAAQSQALDFILTGVLISPQVQLAVLQPSGGGEAQRVRVGKSPEGAAGWRLLEVQPRRAIFEGGSGEGRLFSYALKHIKARDLADRLAEVFGNGAGQSQQGEQPSLMPGVESTQIRSGGVDDKGGTSSAAIGSGGDGASLPSGGTGNGRVTLRVDGTEVGVSAVEDTNSLLVRASPAAWKSIREVIERLDVMPMQVHIEAQVVSVVLSGALQYGVSWFFDNAIPEQTDFPYPTGRNSWGSYGSSVAPAEGFGNVLTWSFLGNSAAAIVQALDNVSDVRTLSSPSVFTQNNKEASLNVGQRIPINSVSFDPTAG